MQSKTIISAYGNETVARGYCTKCRQYSFVVNNKLTCCGLVYKFSPKVVFQRVSTPRQTRQQISQDAKRRILLEQSYCCHYCGVDFNTWRNRNGKSFKITIAWDHEIPYAYTQDNRECNYVASCNVCNSIKHSRHFVTLEEAQNFLTRRRRELGYDF